MTTWTGYYFRSNDYADPFSDQNSTQTDVEVIGPYAGNDGDGTLRANEGDTINGSQVLSIYAFANTTFTIGGTTYSVNDVIVTELANGEVLFSPFFAFGVNSDVVTALNPSPGVIDSVFFGDLILVNSVSDPEFFQLDTSQYGGPVCFDLGTRIMTPAGERLVQNLRVGDPVLTIEGAHRRILWIGRTDFLFEPGPHRHKPIVFECGSMAPGQPRAPLRVSPQHCVIDPTSNCLIPAKAWTGRKGVRVAKGRRRAAYFSLLLEEHSIIEANGIPCESFYPGAGALRMLSADHRRQIHALLPGITQHPGEAYGPRARQVLSVMKGRQSLCVDLVA